MHLFILFFTLIIVWRYGDWKNWQKYHTTMLYVAVANLFYNFIYTGDNLLWKLQPAFLLGNHKIAEIFYTFIIFPSTVLLLLKNFPSDLKSLSLRLIKFISIYFIFECIAYSLGCISYHNGWTIWWSLVWDFMMFPMWMLHHKKPLISYAVSAAVISCMLVLFPVTIK
ncbi:hypothetical protein OXPF_18340 [Oxobacter pfennigii]|uniref:Uncharacterized protein n=1 Tax=Oxobacter pfennigii TaxID=36849 RepID=A0A0P8W9V6_9CLOT|nr:CBO0543 family protein [Oxobacter pfennigii]KPU44748.1 hypothetical protein OXPF_18340 [Oxobacter pfennigii]